MLNFQTVTFRSFGLLPYMCSSIKALCRSTSMAYFSITVMNTVVSKLPIPKCSVVLPLIFNRFFEADKIDD